MENTQKSKDINNIFDNIIKEGYISKEEEIVKGLKLTIRALSPNEIFRAENEINERNPNIPQDITAKLRCAKILSYAIISINGSNIVTENMSKEEEDERRLSLYINLMKSPTVIIENAYNLYLKTVQEEHLYFTDPEKLNDDIENFSKAQKEK